MTDYSHLDNKYFIDRHVFNCPFCKRNNVSYYLDYREVFDWTYDKECFIYTAHCTSCKKRSMHLSYEDLDLSNIGNRRYQFQTDTDLDAYFFYSVPTSFFALDQRIPKVLRALFIEAEGCLKSNYLTGASACVRKIIYELALIEDVSGDNYDQRIKALKEKRADVEPEHFDTLLTIQQLTSDKVHEASFDGWQNNHLKMLLSTIGEILTLMYVIPEIRKEKRQAVLALKAELAQSNEPENV